jgi:hypothetical protein
VDILLGPWFDLSEAWYPVLSWWSRSELIEGSTAALEGSTDGGETWETLYTQPPERHYWKRTALDLSPWSGNLLRVRFRFAANGVDQEGGWWLDSFSVDEPEPIPGGFLDDAEDDYDLWAIRDLGGGGWPTQNGFWNRVEGAGVDGSHAWSCREPGSTRPAYLENDDLISRPLDITDLRRPELTFRHHYRLDPDAETDVGRVYVSADNGESWVELDKIRGDFDRWHIARYELSDYRSPTLRLRFNLSTDQDFASSPGWVIDDIRLDETDAVYPLEEDFDDGLNGWQVIDEGGYGVWRTSKHHSDRGLYSLWCGNPEVGRPSSFDLDRLISPPIDLRSGPATIVGFQLRHDLNVGDEFYIEASGDGMQSWIRVWELDSTHNLRESWRGEEFELTQFGGRVVFLRLTYDAGGLTPGSGVFLDSLVIDRPY